MKRKWIRVLTPLAVAFSMVLALSFPGRAAELVDLTRKCSLTVSPGVFTGDGSSYLTEQLGSAAVVIDLYKVADAVPNVANGYTYDGYQYELGSQYEGELQITGEMTNADWREQSQKAARIALGVTVDPDTGAVSGSVQTGPVKAAQAVGSRIDDLDAGLYLLIARRGGTEDPNVAYGNVAEYTVINTDEKGTEKVATIAYSHDCVFTFEPELISLPGKDPVTDENGNLVSNTANPGPWRYDMSPVLKVGADIRYNDLRIVKNLLQYENSGPTTFVFEVVATWKDYIHSGIAEGIDKEYRDVVSIDFTQAGTSFKLVEHLPVGAKVTVTEVYSGSTYEPVLEPGDRDAFVKETTISNAEETFEVSFTNRYNERHTGGHGITNNFTYSEEAGRWIWTSTRADGTVGGDPSVSGGNADQGGGTVSGSDGNTP